ncbi:hypothetical protein BN11_4560005 [Nostocoides australiense Ben110]|uniref:Uncharacterized protein n=1 Tax=Nostocoides australiense Ben110 TaxID=1193182 RepID=W6JZC4_9MICO|nr:hypothetical protein BN11_4560005 [Tetrasphaera australiensis Ben110]
MGALDRTVTMIQALAAARLRARLPSHRTIPPIHPLECPQ